MFLQHLMGVLYHPRKEWRAIEGEHYTSKRIFFTQIAILALIPVVSFFIGTTQVGWSISGGEYVKLSTDSAMVAAIGFYFAIWVGVGFIAYTIRWMEKTYGGKADLNACVALTSFTAAPLFLAGLSGLYPVLWFNVIVGLIAVSYSVYLLYSGVPEIMHIPEDRAFFFSTSILTVGLCVLVGVIATSVIVWTEVAPLTYTG